MPRYRTPLLHPSLLHPALLHPSLLHPTLLHPPLPHLQIASALGFDHAAVNVHYAAQCGSAHQCVCTLGGAYNRTRARKQC